MKTAILVLTGICVALMIALAALHAKPVQVVTRMDQDLERRTAVALERIADMLEDLPQYLAEKKR